MKATIVRKVANIKDWHDAVAEYKYMHGKEMPKAEVKVEKTIHLTAAEFDKVRTIYSKTANGCRKTRI